jgi:opacity protein-like surface antigen
MSKPRILGVVGLMSALVAAPAAAQPRTSRTGPIVGGTFGVVSIDSGTHAAVSGSIGYKLNSSLSFGIELTGVPEMGSDVPNFPVPLGSPYFARFYGEAEGSATLFTTNVRIDIPTTSTRILPFVAGGGGIANIEESFVFGITPLGGASSSSIFAELSALGLSPSLFPIPFPTSYPVTSSSTGLALTIGGGTSILATDHLSIDVDLRYFRILSEVDRNVGRFGAGVSYRF